MLVLQIGIEVEVEELLGDVAIVRSAHDVMDHRPQRAAVRAERRVGDRERHVVATKPYDEARVPRRGPHFARRHLGAQVGRRRIEVLRLDLVDHRDRRLEVRLVRARLVREPGNRVPVLRVVDVGKRDAPRELRVGQIGVFGRRGEPELLVLRLVVDDAVHAADGHHVVLRDRVLRQRLRVGKMIVVQILDVAIGCHQLHELEAALHVVERNALPARGNQLREIALRRIDDVIDASLRLELRADRLVERIAPAAAPCRDFDRFLLPECDARERQRRARSEPGAEAQHVAAIFGMSVAHRLSPTVFNFRARARSRRTRA
jgi:hypothetical protein